MKKGGNVLRKFGHEAQDKNFPFQMENCEWPALSPSDLKKLNHKMS